LFAKIGLIFSLLTYSNLSIYVSCFCVALVALKIYRTK